MQQINFLPQADVKAFRQNHLNEWLKQEVNAQDS